ncbi:hypothetical protein SG34_022085 [Thalassomonas viridans]|uniref:Uncharacterized protein n=1 Tax=Thalassomonas viridans TaxID=137584 RepID=A0AAE9Z2H5_9GAMM|nr:hypothetical protein [Thalassomonas viridans]WDE04028.1 hypothetical protein SG34_022085 [Thalassomonas viridans]
MAKSNDMPEFHLVKVSLTENIPVPELEPAPKLVSKYKPGHSPAAYAVNVMAVRGGHYHV